MSAQNAPVSNRGELSMSFDAVNRYRMSVVMVLGAKVLGAGVLGAGVAMACLGLATAQPVPPDAPAYAANGDLLLPQKFETWVFAGSNLGLGYSPDVPNNTRAEAARQVQTQQFHNVYINPLAYDAYVKTGKFPEGTMLVMDVYVAASREPSGIVNSGTYNGPRITIEVAVKNSKRPDGSKTDWAYYNFTGASPGSLAPQAKAEENADCYACHKSHAGDDNVWVQFYPALRRVKKPE